MKKTEAAVLTVGLWAAAVALSAGVWSAPVRTTETGDLRVPVPEKVTEISLTAVGDNLIHGKIYEQAQARAQAAGKEGYDFSYAYAQIAPALQEHDVNWIDVETLINDEFPASTYPIFSTPGEDGQALYDAGWRIFSLSNNHIYDFGAKGVQATLKYWAKMPGDLLTTGLWAEGKEDEIPIYECKGKKLAFLTYTYGTNGIPTPEDAPERVIYTDETDLIRKQIQEADKRADAVIVGFHWGVEDSHQITDEQRGLAKKAADWGADLIIGNHPHVIQDAEWVRADDGRRVFCIYSLGNFLSTQRHPDQLVGVMLDCDLEIAGSGKDESVRIRNPKLRPLVTVYGAVSSDVHTVFLSDYSDEEARSHGVVQTYGESFSMDVIEKILTDNIQKRWLEME